MSYRTPLLLCLLAVPAGLMAQNLSCVASANPPVVRAEGIAERTGDIVLSCSGAAPNATVTGNLSLFLSVNVTNKIAADGTADVFLTINGSPANAPARVTGVNSVVFNGVSFITSAQGTAELRIRNLRGNASQAMTLPTSTITVFVAFNGGSLVSFTNNQFTVGLPLRGLLTNSSGRLLCSQAGSPLPDTINLSNLIQAGTAFTTTRVTEGFPSAFAPLSDSASLNAATGTRILLSFSAFTPNSRLFVPDAIAGSDADQSTAAGDLGLPAAGGAYTPGRGQLLLVRVTGTDASGAGGTLALQTPAASTTFNSVGEVPLSGGAGYAVYEVVDANPAIQEGAQIPVFLGLTPGGPASATNQTVSLGPVSTVITASTSAPIPRFIAVTPDNDCTLRGDCTARYFPRLVTDVTTLNFNAGAGLSDSQLIPIRNGGTGVLQWTVTSTAPFLQIFSGTGTNNGTARVVANATGLQPGVYTGTVVIDGGPVAGTRTVPVTLTVGAPRPALTGVTGAADSSQTSLVAGSLATIMGVTMGGKTVQVTFDGTPATLLYSSDKQINLLVPAALAGKTTATLVVTADGNASLPMTVRLASSAPAIFASGVLNQDSSVNSAANPAKVGTILQIFATGLPAAGTITAKVHDRDIASPIYAGAAPGATGVQQVNVAVPADLPSMQTYVYVCGGGVCSPATKLYLTQ